MHWLPAKSRKIGVRMITKRIIPCLDVKDGRVVKGVQFAGLKEVENPVVLADFYNRQGADELVFYDITASAEQRELFTDILQQVAQKVFIPLTVGGGINQLSDFERVLSSGADKVSINSGAIRNPSLVEESAKRYGCQCVVLSLDVKRVENCWHIFAKGGREDTGLDALEWAVYGWEHGAGELVVNSMDTDGVKQGFDLELLKEISQQVPIPIVASGGAGKAQDFLELFKLEGIDAGLAASIFHYGEVKIPELKRYLAEHQIPMRME